MANGNAVKLDGVGSFALTVQCHKTGVDRAEDVDTYSQITNVKVQFRPEKASVQVAQTTTGEAPPDGGASLHLESRVSPL